MPYNNDSKPASTYNNDSLNFVVWADSRYTWADSLISWANSQPIFEQYTDDTKTSSSYSNDSKPS